MVWLGHAGSGEVRSAEAGQGEARGRLDLLPARIREALPEEVLAVWPAGLSAVEEIRLRRGRGVSLTLPEGNRLLPVWLSGEEMEAVLLRLCGGSLYAYAETMRQGYLSLPGNVRVGVSGRAAVEGGQVTGLSPVSSLCIRLPRRMRQAGHAIARLAREGGGGILLYAPPGVGKTTCLRGILACLAGGENPLRVAVIDTREELEVPGAPLADYLIGYPRGVGMEIATRCLNPQWILCDELGDEAEARAVVAAQHCGVPLLASAHGRELTDLLCRPGLALLHRAGIFRYYVRLGRSFSGDGFSYAVTPREEVRDG